MQQSEIWWRRACERLSVESRLCVSQTAKGEPITGGTWKEEFFRLWACRDRWVEPAVDEVERVKERFRRIAAGEDPTAVDAEIDAAVGAGGGG